MLAKKKQNQNEISATVADNHLVLSLPNATEPVIWRQSLDEIGSATFEVKKSSKKELYNLTLKKTKTSSETIASFDEKDDAIAALSAASAAFHGGNATTSQASPVKSANQNEQTTGGGKKWVYALIALVIVIGLYSYMSSLIPAENTFLSNASVSTAPSAAPVTPDSTGVPVSADDFLSGM